MSSSGTSSSDSRSPISVEQVLGECFVRAAQTILTSRIYEGDNAPTSQRGKRSTWFKLELEELQSARAGLERWRGERGIGLPLVLEVYIQPWGAATPAAAAAASSGASSGTLLERWTLRLGPSPAAPLPLGGALTRSQMMRLNPQGVYKRLTLMLRSLYAYVRVLPAYRLFRAARRQRGAAFALAYRLHSTLPSRGGGGAPAPRRMQRFDFTPVDTADGQLHMGVDYQPASAVRVLAEQAAAPLPRTHIIVDYVGGRGGARAQRASEEGPPLGSPLSTAPSAPASLDGTPRRSSWSSTLRWGAAPRLSPGGTSTAPPSPASSPRVRWQDVGAGGAAQLLEGAAPRPGAAAPPPRSYSTPPRPAAGPAPLAPGAAWSPSTRQAPAPAQALAEGSGGDGPAGDGAPPAGSAARRPTAPMRIPGTGTGASPRPSRRLRSSNDLRGLQGEEPARDKPLSAPAVSHVQRPGAVAVVPSAADPPPAATGPSPGGSTPPASPSAPAAPPPPPPASLGSLSGSGASSSAPLPSSPDLPFAFTPSGGSAASPRPAPAMPALARASPAPAPAAAAGAGAPAAAGPPSMALVRHASWGGRSISGGEGSVQRGIGYSVSPMQGPALESLLYGSSTPRQHFGAGALPDRAAGGSLRGAGTPAAGPPALLTFRETPPAAGAPLLGEGGARGRAPEELDPLPFAYRLGGTGPSSGRRRAPFDPASAGSSARGSPSSSQGLEEEEEEEEEEDGGAREDAARLAAAADGASSAAAVGAFVSLLHAAPPLAGAAPMALEEGLQALAGMRARLRAPGRRAAA